MRLSKSLYSFKILLVVFLLFAYASSSANTGTPNPKKVEDNQKIETPVQQDADAESKEDLTNQNEIQEDSEATISNSSFNYFFYLIYKAKFEDVLRLPGRSTGTSGIDIHRVNLTALVERFVNPKF